MRLKLVDKENIMFISISVIFILLIISIAMFLSAIKNEYIQNWITPLVQGMNVVSLTLMFTLLFLFLIDRKLPPIKKGVKYPFIVNLILIYILYQIFGNVIYRWLFHNLPSDFFKSGYIHLNYIPSTVFILIFV